MLLVVFFYHRAFLLLSQLSYSTNTGCSRALFSCLSLGRHRVPAMACSKSMAHVSSFQSRVHSLYYLCMHSYVPSHAPINAHHTFSTSLVHALSPPPLSFSLSLSLSPPPSLHLQMLYLVEALDMSWLTSGLSAVPLSSMRSYRPSKTMSMLWMTSYRYDTHVHLHKYCDKVLYSGKLLREKTFTNLFSLRAI